jgi:hypothetical protein
MLNKYCMHISFECLSIVYKLGSYQEPESKVEFIERKERTLEYSEP